ncbi:MAG TPA: UDP-N-acetylmuramate--L-alanine ligase [Burkholderiales bacterium]|jgi:UDP-N-acetylmuramate--alanine ligase|nr:UDP-N-acetylmuramate--L-alanine ligase [Burkholderiales bacterium]
MKYKVKRVHFVGIGGAGMSGIAEVLLNLGFEVSGSDLNDNAVTRRLQRLGAKVLQGHAAANIASADAVVVSSAVKDDNPEVIAARAHKIPVVPRALMLAELMRLKQGIAVAGTHGKTTTTSLVASVLAQAGMDPTFVIGGRLEAAGSHAKLGSGEFIVVEADESDASFLFLAPVLAVVTNIDADHMETYGHYFGRLRQAFLDFVQRLPFYGTAVLCVDDPNVREIMPAVTKPVTTYGLSDTAQIRAVDLKADAGRMHFRVVRSDARGTPLADLQVTLNLAGEHNVLNSLAAIAVGMEVGAPDAAIVKALADFAGVGRRFQRYGDIALEPGATAGRYTLIDDYGHHPAEMAATLAAVHGAFPGRRVVLAFQPHRYSRTRDCFEDFIKVLSTVDVLLLTEVYAAGETPIIAADGRALVRAVRVLGKVEPIFVEQIADFPDAIRNVVKESDVVVTMGAGSIGGVASLLAGGQR